MLEKLLLFEVNSIWWTTCEKRKRKQQENKKRKQARSSSSAQPCASCGEKKERTAQTDAARKGTSHTHLRTCRRSSCTQKTKTASRKARDRPRMRMRRRKVEKSGIFSVFLPQAGSFTTLFSYTHCLYITRVVGTRFWEKLSATTCKTASPRHRPAASVCQFPFPAVPASLPAASPSQRYLLHL